MLEFSRMNVCVDKVAHNLNIIPLIRVSTVERIPRTVVLFDVSKLNLAGFIDRECDFLVM